MKYHKSCIFLTGMSNLYCTSSHQLTTASSQTHCNIVISNSYSSICTQLHSLVRPTSALLLLESHFPLMMMQDTIDKLPLDWTLEAIINESTYVLFCVLAISSGRNPAPCNVARSQGQVSFGI